MAARTSCRKVVQNLDSLSLKIASEVCLQSFYSLKNVIKHYSHISLCKI